MKVWPVQINSVKSEFSPIRPCFDRLNRCNLNKFSLKYFLVRSYEAIRRIISFQLAKMQIIIATLPFCNIFLVSAHGKFFWIVDKWLTKFSLNHYNDTVTALAYYFRVIVYRHNTLHLGVLLAYLVGLDSRLLTVFSWGSPLEMPRNALSL